MCFFIHEDHKNPKIAKKPINCYKTFQIVDEENFMSIYQEHPYKIGLKYSLGHKLIPTYRSIDEGFHSYTAKSVAKVAKEDLIYHGIIYDNLCMVKCVIPEGAEYYYNPEDKEYVSDHIIIAEKIEK